MKMNYHFSTDWRNRRNPHFGNITANLTPLHYSIASYCSDNKTEMKSEKSSLDDIFGSEVYLGQLHTLPNPLQKNLADALPNITGSKPEKQKNTPIRRASLDFTSDMGVETRSDVTEQSHAAFASIGNFISGVFNVITAVMPFQKRSRPQQKLFNDVTESAIHDGSPPLDVWLPAKSELQNRNDYGQYSVQPCGKSAYAASEREMSGDCRAAAAHCENKLNRVKTLLNNKNVVPKSSPIRPRRPKKVFVQPNSIEESFEDAFSPEDFSRLANSDCIHFVSPSCNTLPDVLEIDGPMTKTEMGPLESTEIVQIVPDSIEICSPPVEICSPPIEICSPPIEICSPAIEEVIKDNKEDVDMKTQIIQSCEDKVSRLKALLLERRKNNKTLFSPDSGTESVKEDIRHVIRNRPQPISISKPQCKNYKNPHRLCSDKRRKTLMKKNIEEDMFFGQELDVDLPSSVENSPRPDAPLLKDTQNCYFDEIAGKFHNMPSSVESDDSFQIVFQDSPNLSPATRKFSDCDSEDSFIIFEDSPDSCYVSTDVFGDESDSDIESTDVESDFNDGTCKLHHALSRTVSDLTDDSLYDDNTVSKSEVLDSEDEVDCAVKLCDEIPDEKLRVCDDLVVENKGLLLTAAKKLARKSLPPKQVRFSEDPPKVKVMRVWAFAARQARAGHWEQHVLDRDRFKRRIADVEMAISWVLKPDHRSRVKFHRFMPWWHAQRRKEEAEKKEAQKKAAEDALKAAEDAQKAAEEAQKAAEEAQKAAEEAQKAEEDAQKLGQDETAKEKTEDVLEVSYKTNCVHKEVVKADCSFDNKIEDTVLTQIDKLDDITVSGKIINDMGNLNLN